jgi:threonyl-tRNA synthetase
LDNGSRQLEDALEVYRHTTSHIMAQAVKRLYPNVRLAIGPAISDGFYYDFDFEKPISQDELPAIEEEMSRIIAENLPITRLEMTRDDAIAFFKERGETYKVELIKDLPDEQVSFYTQGEFVDLCRGPHLPSTGKVKAFKLLSLAGAYWRGDSSKPMLQRIYGTSYPNKADLQAHLRRLEEAAKRDHRKIGRDLDLFSVIDEGPGFPFFHPKGMIIRNQLEEFWRKEHVNAGYREVKTPIILSRELWENSGHWDKYRENMYFTVIDERDFAIKPMNCPGSILLYKRELHSYRDLPLRMCELGLVHRHELSGVLHGLMRVRCFTQDDAHIFMTPSQIRQEILGVIQLIQKFYSVFGFTYRVELSTKPDNAIGDDDIWEVAINALKDALEVAGLPYEINEGDGAFYGPKIDFHLLDCLGRSWQCGTIQIDFVMPERFDLLYVGEDGQQHRPVMLHRVVFGSIERFIAILTEHFAGDFPTWLAPVQVRVIPISEAHIDYAERVRDTLRESGIRVETDSRNEKVGYKIRQGEIAKIPYMLIVGDREKENAQVSVRLRHKGDIGSMSVDEFRRRLQDEIDRKLIQTN